jgi:hypothetical protein
MFANLPVEFPVFTTPSTQHVDPEDDLNICPGCSFFNGAGLLYVAIALCNPANSHKN